MIGRTNTGGGLSDSNAILRVTVPTGSSVTAAKGGVTKHAKLWTQNADNTLDTAIIPIPAGSFDSNPWTVTATKSGESITKTVIINASNEYDITLVWLSVIKNGYFVNGYTSAVNLRNGQPVIVTENYNSSGFMKVTAQGSFSSGLGLNSTDVSRYNTMYFDGYANASLANNGNGIVGIYPSYNYNNTSDIQNSALVKATFTNTSTAQKTVDISSVSGSRYMAVALYITGSSALAPYDVFVKDLILYV